jgi:hypothetical protein
VVVKTLVSQSSWRARLRGKRGPEVEGMGYNLGGLGALEMMRRRHPPDRVAL